VDVPAGHGDGGILVVINADQALVLALRLLLVQPQLGFQRLDDLLLVLGGGSR